MDRLALLVPYIAYALLISAIFVIPRVYSRRKHRLGRISSRKDSLNPRRAVMAVKTLYMTFEGRVL